MKDLKKSAGGKRANSGNKKGAVFAKTIEKEAARAALRQIVLRHMEPLVQRMIASAMGIGHLFKRDSTGKFTRIEDDKEINRLMTECVEGRDYWIFSKDPSVQAFTDLMNRAVDKPIEAVEMNHGGEIVIKHEL